MDDQAFTLRLIAHSMTANAALRDLALIASRFLRADEPILARVEDIVATGNQLDKELAEALHAELEKTP